MNYTSVAITVIICLTVLALCHEPKDRKYALMPGCGS